MRKFILLLIGYVMILNAQSQTPEKTIVSFFETFKTRDSVALKSFFAPHVSMVTTYKNKRDSMIVQVGKLQPFITSIGTKDDNTLEEKIYNLESKISDGLAQVWCDYEFYLNGELHHCGVDAFHLVLMQGKWKITHLADTRRRQCDIKY